MFDKLFDIKKEFTFEELKNIDNKEVLISILKSMTVANLKKVVKSQGIKGYSKLKKKEVAKIVYDMIYPATESCIDELILKIEVIMNNEQLSLPLPIEHKPLKDIPESLKPYGIDEHLTTLWDKEFSNTPPEPIYFYEEHCSRKLFDERYKYLCFVLHPDKGGNTEEFQAMMREYKYLLNEAFMTDKELQKQRETDTFEKQVKRDIEATKVSRTVHWQGLTCFELKQEENRKKI